MSRKVTALEKYGGVILTMITAFYFVVDEIYEKPAQLCDCILNGARDFQRAARYSRPLTSPLLKIFSLFAYALVSRSLIRTFLEKLWLAPF